MKPHKVSRCGPRWSGFRIWLITKQAGVTAKIALAPSCERTFFCRPGNCSAHECSREWGCQNENRAGSAKRRPDKVVTRLPRRTRRRAERIRSRGEVHGSRHGLPSCATAGGCRCFRLLERTARALVTHERTRFVRGPAEKTTLAPRSVGEVRVRRFLDLARNVHHQKVGKWVDCAQVKPRSMTRTKMSANCRS